MDTKDLVIRINEADNKAYDAKDDLGIIIYDYYHLVLDMLAKHAESGPVGTITLVLDHLRYDLDGYDIERTDATVSLLDALDEALKYADALNMTENGIFETECSSCEGTGKVTR